MRRDGPTAKDLSFPRHAKGARRGSSGDKDLERNGSRFEERSANRKRGTWEGAPRGRGKRPPSKGGGGVTGDRKETGRGGNQKKKGSTTCQKLRANEQANGGERANNAREAVGA